MNIFKEENTTNRNPERLYRFAIISISITMISVLFSVFFGLMNDDYLFIRVFDLEYYGNNLVNQLNRTFAFYTSIPENQTTIAQGYSQANWWTGTDTAHWFFRPLAAFSHYLDYQLIPRQLELMHIHNYLYLILSLFLLFKFLEEFNLPAAHKMIIVSFFIVDSATLWSGWIAQRNAYMALSGMLGALIFHIRFLRDGAISKYLTAIFLFCLALLSSEAGIVTTVFLFFMPLALHRPLFTKQHILHMIPYALICLFFLLVYKHYDFGVSNHPFYTDPLSEPIQAISSLGKKLPFFMLSAAGIIPAESAYLLDFLHPGFHLIILFFLNLIVILALALAWKTINLQHRPLFAYGILCGFFALLPLTGSMIADRSGSFLKLGISIAIGTLVFQMASSSSNRRIRMIINAIPPIFLFKSILIFVASVTAAFILSKPDPLLTPLKDLKISTHHVVYIKVHDIFFSSYTLEKIRYSSRKDVKTAHRLVANNGDVILERTDFQTIILSSQNDVLLSRRDLVMDKVTFHAGQRFDAGLMQLEIMEEINGLPKKIKIRFNIPTDTIQFLNYGENMRYQAITLPPIGSHLIL